MPAPSFWLALALSVLLLWAGQAQAAVALRDATQLTQALKTKPPCCVIDARSDENQRRHPIPDVVPYRPGLSIIPTASIVVLADRDRDAMKIGAVLAKRHPGKVIYAVKGGATAWESLLKSMERTSSSKASMSKAPVAADSGISFVIPHDTCETGTPLQTLQSKPKSVP